MFLILPRSELIFLGSLAYGLKSMSSTFIFRLHTSNRRERDHRGDLGVDGWIILGWISRRWDVCIWTGLGWPRIETGGGRL